MKKFMVPLSLAVVMAIATPAWASAQVSGSISSIDPNAREIVLDNGKTYSVQPDVDLAKLAPWDKVTMNTETKGKQNIVDKVTKTG
jgi:hypothetical protein